MKENTLHYNYNATVREIYDLTKEEAIALAEKEQSSANEKNHAIILTGRGYDNKSFFRAYASKSLSHSYTWIHFCPQDILCFDDVAPQEGKYYVMLYESIEK